MADNSSGRMLPSWLIWVIAPVTILAAAIIILALVLGIQAGQRQVEEQRRQQAGIAIQRAMDYRTEGMLDEALAEYQRVLVLDPGNTAAVTGIESLLQIAADSAGPADVSMLAPSENSESAPTASPPVAASPTAEPTSLPAAPEEQLWAQARQAYETGSWRDAETALLELQTSAPDFLAAEVRETLYNIYVNLSAELDREGDLELALTYVDKALELHPEETQLREARELAVAYLDVLTVSGADWERTIEMLEALYVQNPGYRDVTERLREAHIELGDSQAEKKDWCKAAAQYRSAVAIHSTADTITQRNALEDRCDLIEGDLAMLDDSPTPASGPTGTAEPTSTVRSDTEQAAQTHTIAPADDEDDESEDGVSENGIGGDEGRDEDEAAVAPTSLPGPSLATLTGRIMYSAKDPVTNQTNVFIKELDSNTPAVLLVENARQAEFRPDGRRVVYKNLRSDNRGLTSLDPDTGLELRFTDYAEDARPSWNGEGNRITFSSNREGDRLWRVYSLWADVDNEPQLLAYGDSPSWSRAANQIAYRGCDERGNQCGIWLMNGNGGDNHPFTRTPADDRPDWSPAGDFIAFMSNSRDGNPEIYRADTSDNTVTRLSNNGAIDGLPVVSPDGNWVAFVSNRSGSWAVYATPSSGGEAQALFTVSGALDAWQEHNLQWLP